VQAQQQAVCRSSHGSSAHELCYVCGVLCRAVCRQLGWPLIDKDDARDCLQQLPAGVDANQLSYDIMFSYASTQLQLGLSTVLDCPFARVCLYDRAQALAEQVRNGGQRTACSWCAWLKLV
jgi:predicted kinase